MLEHIHGAYIPKQFDDSLVSACSNLAVVGYQGSVERGVNVLLQLRNGFDKSESLDGERMEIGDFHAGMKFLQVCYKAAYMKSSHIRNLHMQEIYSCS